MERATSPESHMEPQVFIIALASGLIGVALVASFIYFGCFSSARRAHRISQQNGNTANHHGGSSSKSKENSSHKRRSNSVHSSNNHIERYPPKYPSDLFYPLDQSGSNSSSSHYRVRMAECVYCILVDSYWDEINFGKVGNTVVIEDQNYGRTKQYALRTHTKLLRTNFWKLGTFSYFLQNYVQCSKSKQTPWNYHEFLFALW